MFDIREDQFLVLLFVVERDLKGHQEARELGLGEVLLHQLIKSLIDMLAVGEDSGEGGAAQCAALLSRELWSQALIIGVEQAVEAGIKGLISGEVSGEHQGFKKPGCMSQMPPGRADESHGLGPLIFNRKGLSQRQGAAADLVEATEKALRGLLHRR